MESKMKVLNIGVRHFQLIQWVGVVVIVSYAVFLYRAFFGDRPWDWWTWFLLFTHGFAALVSAFWIEYPGRDGFSKGDDGEVAPPSD